MRALAAVAVVLVVAGCSASPEPEPSASPATVSEVEALGRELCDLMRADELTGGAYLDITERAAVLVGAEGEEFGVGETLIAIYCPQFG